MKRIINTLLFLSVAMITMAQTSFVVADKNGNSQLVQSLVFQQQQTADRFSWKSDGSATGDIKDLLFIARAKAELATANSDNVTEMLEQISGTGLADAEAIAAALTSNNNVEEAFTEDNSNLILQLKNSNTHVVYPLYEDEPLFSEEAFPDVESYMAKTSKARRGRAQGDINRGKIAIFNHFQGRNNYKVQNRMVSYIKVMFETNGYDVEYYGNMADPAHFGNVDYDQLFNSTNLTEVIQHSGDYKAILIFSHGFVWAKKSYFATCEKVEIDKDAKEVVFYNLDKEEGIYYDAYPVEGLKVDRNCIVYLGSCYGLPEGVDDSFLDRNQTPFIGWRGKNCVAQADAGFVFYYMLNEGYDLKTALNETFKKDLRYKESLRYESKYISNQTLDGDKSNYPDYGYLKVSMKPRLGTAENGGRKISYLCMDGTFNNNWSSDICKISIEPVFWKDGALPYNYVTTKTFYSSLCLENVPEGLYLMKVERIIKKGLYERVKQTNIRSLIINSNFFQDNSEEVLSVEDIYTPSIISSNGQATEDISVAAGSNMTFTIDGYSGHSFWALSLDEDIAKVSVNGTSLTVTGVTEGTTYIGVQDYQNKQIAVAKVNVTEGGSFQNGQIVMTRRLYVHHNDDYNYSGITFAFNNGKNLDLRYFNTDYWQDWSHSIRGIYIMSSNADDNVNDYGDYHDANRHTKEWYIAPIIQDEWFTEKLVIHTDGRVQYYLNDEYMGEEVFDGLNLSEASSFNLEISPWGWWTGMYTYMDDFYLSTPSATYSDNFNDGVIDLSIWKEPINPDGVREEDGIIKMEQLRTDQNFCLYIENIPLAASGDVPAYPSCPDNNHPHMIDLGLPSGTKWACCNVGAHTPEEYGSFFAWGETTGEKDYYTPSTYIHCDDVYDCHNIGSDIAGSQYDAATANWGSPWVMPNNEQMEELINDCSSEWTSENSVNGLRFTGSNGASIFLPAAGRRLSGLWPDELAYGYYWSSTLNESVTYRAWEMEFDSDGISTGDFNRYLGYSIRPVRRN